MQKLTSLTRSPSKYLLFAGLILGSTAALWALLGRSAESLDFLPHSFCYLGNRTLITTHLVSDLTIGASYIAISLTLGYILWKAKRSMPFHWLFIAFGLFIIACGGTHFMEAITLFQPVYWASGYVKAVTAAASLAVAIALPLLTGRILGTLERARVAEERTAQLERANGDLEHLTAKLNDMDRLKNNFVAQKAARIGTWEWDMLSGKVTWSEEVEAIHGLPRRSFGGKFRDWLHTIHTEDRENVLLAIRQAMQQKGEYDIEYRTDRPDGIFYWTAGRGKVICDQSGTPVRMLGISMDITARKESELQNSKQARVLDLANDAIFVMDLNGTITYWNQGAERLYGFTKEEAHGRNAHELLQTVFPEPLEAINAKVLLHDEWAGEVHHTTKDGSEVAVASRWTLQRDEKGRPEATFEVNRDITDQKKAEEALRKSEKLAAAGRLAATIAHEINNPLEAITNLVFLAHNNEAVPPNVKAHLEEAERQLTRVAHVTRQTLGFYRESSSPTTVSVAQIIEETLALYAGRLQGKSITVEQQCDADLKIECFPGELRQVMANLIANAIDAVEVHGIIRAHVHRYTFRGEEGARIVIADNGCGIPRDQLGDIFEPFFTTKKDVGTGLGLWVSREIVRKHRGAIRVRTCARSKFSWTLFSIFIPAEIRHGYPSDEEKANTSDGAAA